MHETRASLEYLVKKKSVTRMEAVLRATDVLPASDPTWEQTTPKLHAHHMVQPPV